MKFVIQRVSQASVSVDNCVMGEINKGFLVFIGISNDDTTKTADIMIKKMINLRIFEDENNKINLSLSQVKGELLLISQFTLYADTKKGNRPSFIDAGSPIKANLLYEYIIQECKKHCGIVKQGVFGEDMQVSLCNSGPFTIILDSSELIKK